MISKLTQRLLTLALVFVFTFCLWEIPFASANHYFTNSDEIRDNIELSKNDFTPQENQALQAIRQRRNKEIARILNSSQRQLLVHKLHNGNNIDQALDSLNLSSEQRELVNSINVFTNLKLKGIFSRHALLDSHK
jgi:ABC-type multidrug transport system fused ATPase/permease subunit